MSRIHNIVTVLIIGFISAGLSAQEIPLQNLTQDDYKNIVGELSTNFLHTSVQGAGTLGSIWGFEIGLVAGMTKTPEIDSLVQRAEPDTHVKQVYDAALLGVVTVPFGITVEASLVPKVGSDKFKFQTMGLAAKWTPSELFFDLPVDVAVKLSLTKSQVDFKDTISGVDTTFKFEDAQTAVTFFVSKNFAVLEPYVALGFVNSKGDLDVNGSTTVFANSYTSSQSASEKRSGMLWMVGTEAKLVLVKFGLEYMNMYDTSRIMGKFSFSF